MFNALRACSRLTPSVAPIPRQWAGRTRRYSDLVAGMLATPTRSGILANPPQAGASGYPPPIPLPEAYKGSAATRLRLHCHSSPNNTIATLTKEDGSTIAWFSGGSCGFKKGNRATYEAGYQCAVRSFKKIEEINVKDGPVVVDLFFKGFGQGRDALKGALLATEGEAIRSLVSTITDRTPIKIGGTRAKKTARL